MKIDPVVQKKVMKRALMFDLRIGCTIVAPLITPLVILLHYVEGYPWSEALLFLLLIPGIILTTMASAITTYLRGESYSPWMYEALDLPVPKEDEEPESDEEESEEEE